jgi:hypothetical protein
MRKMQNKEYDLLRPWRTLDPWQIKYINTRGHCFLLCGRQSGKTAAMSIKFGKRAAENENRIIGMFAFTEKQAYNLFFKTLMYLEAVYPRMIKRGKDKPTKHQIKLKNGSLIMCYAVGLSGEGIRTFTLTDLVVDEGAPMSREVFIALTPMLSVTKGSMDISSTPRGKEGYFYECSDQCPKVKPNFTRFYVSAEDCPRHSKEFLDSEKVSMTRLEYAQEYLARFLDEVRQFYPTKVIKKTCMISERKQIFKKSKDYFLGVDVAGFGKDISTFESLDGTKRENVFQVAHETTEKWNKTLTTQISGKIIDLNKRWNYNKIGVDDGGLGFGVFSELMDEDNVKRKVVALNNSSRTKDREGKTTRLLKEEMHVNLLIMMERGEIKLFDDKDIIVALKSVMAEESEGKLKIWGKEIHIVEGLKRAAWCAKNKTLNIWIR